MLATLRSCHRLLVGVAPSKGLTTRAAGRAGVKKPRTLLQATSRPVVAARHLHSTPSAAGTGGVIPRVAPPEENFTLDGDVVSQSRLNEILQHLGEDPEVPILQETEIELEPFLVNEVLDVGRHTKVLPGTSPLLLTRPTTKWMASSLTSSGLHSSSICLFGFLNLH